MPAFEDLDTTLPAADPGDVASAKVIVYVDGEPVIADASDFPGSGEGGGGTDDRLPDPENEAAGQAVVTDGEDGYELAALAAVATSGSYNDLTDTPTLGTAAAADTGDFATAAQGALADTATQPGDLAAVATSGDYDDLTNKPTLGTAAAEDLVDAVDTEGVARVVFIPFGGELPEGLSAWTLVVELPEE